jgi:hypothetical protein
VGVENDPEHGGLPVATGSEPPCIPAVAVAVARSLPLREALR